MKKNLVTYPEGEFLCAVKWEGDFPKERWLTVYQTVGGQILVAYNTKTSEESFSVMERGAIVKFFGDNVPKSTKIE